MALYLNFAERKLKKMEQLHDIYVIIPFWRTNTQYRLTMLPQFENHVSCLLWFGEK